MESQSFFDVSYVDLPNNERLAFRRITNETPSPILLFIHGQMTTSSWFYEISKKLKSHFDLIFLDLRGYGRSSYNSPIYTMKELANDVLLFTKKLGINKFGLLGFSLGGAVALQFASLYSELLDNLILVSTTGVTGFPIPDPTGKRVSTFEDMRNHWYFKQVVEKMKGGDVSYFFKMFASELEKINRMQESKDIHRFFIEEIMLQRNLFETCWASNSFNISDEHNSIIQGTNEIGNITCPTLLIHGTADKSIPYQESEKIFKLISSKQKVLEIVKGIDHYTIVNNSEVISDLIKKHILKI